MDGILKREKSILFKKVFLTIIVYTHTHTHAHTRAHTRTHTRTHTHTHRRSNKKLYQLRTHHTNKVFQCLATHMGTNGVVQHKLKGEMTRRPSRDERVANVFAAVIVNPHDCTRKITHDPGLRHFNLENSGRLTQHLIQITFTLMQIVGKMTFRIVLFVKLVSKHEA